jgi:hypothetical protein
MQDVLVEANKPQTDMSRLLTSKVPCAGFTLTRRSTNQRINHPHWGRATH